MLRAFFLTISGLVLLGGCARNEPIQSTADLTVVEMAVLPAPGREDLVAPDRPSFIGPLDTINVEVFNVTELTRDIVVDSGGRVTMPLVGTIDVNGMTAVELASRIDESLRGRYVRDPQVTVTIKGSVSQVVTVDGEIENPGTYPVTNQSTLLRTLALSGGFTENAKLDDVVILRTVGQQRMAGLYNVSQIRRGAYVDPPIYPNDVVVVGDSPSRRLFRDFIAVSPLLAAPLIAVLQ
ncbi:polysaccharide biosynthesis/export family protein [Sphingomonas sp. AX6]|uniref:polysaccharide biosynthesis/export family protein n=1 Tax=Sphingomonas sp. AX6 TaxID=2653171 RepID=UPI0012EFADE0|nr:polysaccharide biosynthesis/export family protein [Sphingomonas sp. AX6]VXC47836.1 Polysaccharide export protein [Sphingomonas sp. AX6]